MPNETDARLAEVQIATARALRRLFTEIRPLAERILAVDTQLATMLTILDAERGEPQ